MKNVKSKIDNGLDLDTINEYFVSHAKEIIIEEYGEYGENNDNLKLLENIPQTNQSLDFSTLDEVSTLDTISKLSITESTGFDRLSAKMIKFSAFLVIPHILALINLTILLHSRNSGRTQKSYLFVKKRKKRSQQLSANLSIVCFE
jgi:hypothetical protein